MEDRDISIKTPSGRFNYRVGAIIIHAGRLLMVKNSNSSFYYTVGGRVKFGESSEQAVLREVFEETRIPFAVDRLAYIHENFFVWRVGSEPFHELAFFYLMKPNPALEGLLCDTRAEDGGQESLHWLPLDRLNEYPLYPEFFKTSLQNPTDRVAHFLTKDNRTVRCTP